MEFFLTGWDSSKRCSLPWRGYSLSFRRQQKLGVQTSTAYESLERSSKKKERLLIVDLMENPADFDSFMQDSNLSGNDYSLEIQKSFDGEILKRVILTKRQGRVTREIHSQRYLPHEHFLAECENLGLKIHKVISLDRHKLYFLKT